MAAQAIPVGTASTLNANAFSRTNYDFVGWNTKPGGTGTSYSNGASITPAQEDITLYAQWARQTVTITFDKNASDATGTMANQTIDKAISTPLAANAFSRTNYDFAGWNTKSDGTGVNYANSALVSLTANTTLYAKWSLKTYTITWNGNGGSTPSATTLVYGSTLGTLPTSTYDEGHKFLGWFTDATGGTQISETTTVTDNATYWAHWEECAATGTFDGEFCRANKSKWNNTNYYTMQDVPSICHNISTPTTTEDISTQLIDTRDGKLYWVSKLKDGNCWMTQNLDYDIKATGNEVAVTDGTTTTWSPGAATTTSILNNQSNTGTYSQDPGSKYLPNGTGSATNITCNSTTNGGANCHYHLGNYYQWNAATAGSGGTITNKDATTSVCPKGWRLPTSKAATVDYSFNKLTSAYSIASNTTGAAALIRSPLWFVRAGGVGLGISFDVGKQGGVWAIDALSDGGSAGYITFNSSVVSVTSGIRHFAVSVRCVAQREAYTVTWNANGGSVSPATSTVEGGRTIDTLPTPTRDGYTFLGWFTAQTGGSQISATTTVTKNTTYYAHWGERCSGYQKMQDIATIKSSLGEEVQTQLCDTRDEKIYWVAKLKDGNVWMTQNLDLDLSSSKTLTPSDTNITSDWTPASTATTIKTTNLSPSSNWATDSDYTHPYSFDGGDAYLPDGLLSDDCTNKNISACSGTGTLDLTDSVAVKDNVNAHYHVGNLYTWTAALAMNNSSSINATNYTNPVSTSICPKGWRLPTGYDGSSSANGDFKKLDIAYGGSNKDGTLRVAPLFFTRSGYVGSVSLSGVGFSSYYWSSTVRSSDTAYNLSFGIFFASFPTYSGRNYGYSVRCVAE